MGLMAAFSPSTPVGLFPSSSIPPTVPSSTTSLSVLRSTRHPPSPSHVAASQRPQTSPTVLASTDEGEYPLEPEPHSATATNNNNKKKKKRKKPRPNFYDQTMERWSIRISSQRSRFPWQVQQAHEEDDMVEAEEEKTKPSPLATLCPSLPVTGGGYGSGDRMAVSAPWAHGARRSSIPRLACEAKSLVPAKSSELKGDGVRRPGSAVEELDERSPVQNSANSNYSNSIYPSLPKDATAHVSERASLNSRKTHLSSKPGSETPLETRSIEEEVKKTRVDSIIQKLKNSFVQLDSHVKVNYDEEKGVDHDRDIGNLLGSVSFPWERNSGNGDVERLQRRSNTELAERTIPEPELQRLRNVALRMKERTKVGPAGVTEALVESIHEKWKEIEVVKLKFEGPPVLHMKRTHEDLEKLTGGVLLSRNKEFIVFYRGNDFLIPSIADVLAERQKVANVRQDEEEQARVRASELVISSTQTPSIPLVAGTLAETLEAKARWGDQLSSENRERMMRDLALDQQASHIRYLEKKLALAQEKVRKAEKALRKVQEFLNPAELPSDLEIVTDEERFLFRKMGLKMRAFLSLGRRGVFGGTVENMHLSWKHRELVKIIVKGKSFAQVKHIAISLEAESGGVLVSLDKTTKGYAIVIYRGKNYHRPHVLRPKNLLTKRQALERSIELQRREALNHHISNLREKIDMLKSELDQAENIKEKDHEHMYSQLDDPFLSEDDVEDEGEEAYLETYDSGDEDEDVPLE